jgi:O-antigen ligase
MNIDRFAHPNLKTPVAVAIGIGLAIGLGLHAGNGDFHTVWLVMGGLGLIAYILFFQQHTWKVALGYCFGGFMNTTFGFMVADLEVSLLLAVLLVAVTWWQKNVMEKPPILKHWSFGWFNTIAVFWLVYLGLHTLYNIYEPYRPQDYAFKNLIRTTEMWAGPIALALYFSLRPRRIDIRRSFPTVIAWLMLIGLLANIAIRVYHFIAGDTDQAVDINDPASEMEGFVTIPIVQLTENIFALRGLTPTSMLFCGAFVSTKWFREQTRGTRRLFHLVMILSVVGAAISGGRATLAITIALLLVILIIHRQIGIVLAALAAFAVLIVGMNVAPGLVKRAPVLLRRSMNWALVERDAEASDSISGSSDWRLDLFKSAVSEWESDSRIFWFGRATYSYVDADYIARQLIGEDAMAQTSLRRGATHNTITDILIAYGLCGLVLYCTMVLSFLFLVWKIYRSEHIDELGKMLALVVFVQMSYTFAYGLLGGGGFPTTVAWFYIILVAWLYHHQSRAQAEKNAPTIEPRRPRELAPVGFAARSPMRTRF